MLEPRIYHYQPQTNDERQTPMSATQDKLMALIAARKASVSRQKTIKPEAGRNRYRILPSWRGAGEQFWMDFGQHFIKDASGQVRAVVVCNDRTFGQPCDVCNALEHAIAHAEDDLTIKRLKDAMAGSRVLLNVLDLNGKNDPTVPQILEVAPSVFNGKKGAGGIISLIQEWPNMLNLHDGVDIIIEKQGAGKEGTSYGVSIASGSKPVDPKVMEKIHNLDKFVAQENEESTRRALTSLAAVAGTALPAPSTAPRLTGIPASVAGNLDTAQEAALRTLEGEATRVTEVVEQPAPATPTPAPAPVTPTVTAAPAPVAAAAPANDPDLEALLASI